MPAVASGQVFFLPKEAGFLDLPGIGMLPVSAHTSDCAGSACPPARRHLSGGCRCSPTPAERVRTSGQIGTRYCFVPAHAAAASDSGSVRDLQFVRCGTGSVQQYSRSPLPFPPGTGPAQVNIRCPQSSLPGTGSVLKHFRIQLLSVQRDPPPAHDFHCSRRKRASCRVRRQSGMYSGSVLPVF